MKRLIKFRGKRTDTGEWVFGNLIETGNGYDFIDTNNELYEDEPYLFRDNTDMIRVAVSKVNKDTVGQFTGLLDKNGKEIYEGDIIRVNAYVNNGQGESYDFRDMFTVEELKGFHRYDYISDVKFNEGGFYLTEYSECDTSICILFGDMRHSFPIFECEVIGNVFDNHELLEGGKE